MLPHSSLGSSERPEGERLQELLRKGDRLMVSDSQQAEALLREALALAREAEDRAGEAQALLLLGATLSVQSQFHVATQLLREAETLAEAVGTPATLARIADNLGICMVSLGEYGRAMEYYQRSLSTAQELGDPGALARALNNIGLVYTELGDHQLALDTYQKARDLTADPALGLELIYLTATINTVRLYEHLGRFSEGLALADVLLPRVRALGYLQHEVVLRVWTLPCLMATGQLTEAVAQAEDLRPLAEQVGDHEHLVYLHLFYGRALTSLGRLEEARQPLRGALDDAKTYDILPLRQKAMMALSDLSAAQGDWREAYRLLAESHQLDQTLRDEALKRKGQILGVEMRLDFLKQEAETERRRSRELSEANAELEAARRQLAYRAAHDPLTGLANRARFQAEVERALETENMFGLLFIDLDRFKHVNDTLGHEVGDELLREISRRLGEVVRSGDLVARMGGDEFTIILRGLREAQDAERVAHKILGRLDEPVQVRGHTLHVTGSIGVAVGPRDGQDASTLQKHADIAMYRAKRDGKNAVQIFQPPMGEETAERVSLAHDLRAALQRGRLTLHYQPQFDARSGALRGFEALVRWPHPEQGLLLPARFLGIAEDSGLMLTLEQWVLSEACRQAAAWDAPGRGLTVSVNVGAPGLGQPDFPDRVRAALEEANLAPRGLVLEVSESVLLGQDAALPDKLRRLRATGVPLALDNFGRGYSSFSVLEQFEFDRLKLDAATLRGPSKRAHALAELLVAFAHRLGVPVVAERVETPEQAATLRELGADQLQGFAQGHPEPAHQVGRWLGKQQGG